MTDLRPSMAGTEVASELPQPVPVVQHPAADAPPPTEAEVAKLRARFTTMAGFNGSLVMAEYATGISGKVNLTDLIEDFRSDVEKIWQGDLKQAEAMLFAQAQALQVIFTHTAQQARHAEKLYHQDLLLRMALKAQAQCRATLETLANIKNPPVVFARQANINQGGQQQVNNAPPPAAPLVPAVSSTPAAKSTSGAERSIRRREAKR